MSRPGELDLALSNFQIVQSILSRLVGSRPVYIFGSRVTGRARRRSDLDIAIGGNPPIGWTLCCDLKEAFDESDLPIRVDVVDLAEATGIFRKRIEGEWLPLEVAAEQLTMRS